MKQNKDLNKTLYLPILKGLYKKHSATIAPKLTITVSTKKNKFCFRICRQKTVPIIIPRKINKKALKFIIFCTKILYQKIKILQKNIAKLKISLYNES